jgi:hypothetical protein
MYLHRIITSGMAASAAVLPDKEGGLSSLYVYSGKVCFYWLDTWIPGLVLISLMTCVWAKS